MAKKLPKWKIDLQKVVDMAMKQVLDETTANDIPIREWIDKIASGEYQPVKHGRWEVRTQKDGTTIGQHNVTYCSECGYVLFTKEDSFCARCGAKMDLKDGDE